MKNDQNRHDVRSGGNCFSNFTMLFQSNPRRDKFCLAVLGIALVVAMLEALIFKNEKETDYNYMILNSIAKLILNIVFTLNSWWKYMTEEFHKNRRIHL